VTPLRSRTESWSHQLRGYSFLDEHNGGILSIHMGGGKSKVSVDYVVSHELSPVLIMAPPSVVAVWSNQFRQHAASNYQVLALGGDAHKRVSVKKRTLEAERFVRNMRSQRQPCAVVINHEGCWREPFARFALEGGKFQCAILDESHRAQDHGGALGNFVMEMAKWIPHRIALTGTPMPRHELNVFSQARFTHPEVFGTRYTPVQTRYAQTGGWQGKGTITIKPDMRTEFIEKCNRVLFVVSKEELDLSLPEETHSQRLCTLAPQFRARYEELRRDYYTELADEIAQGTITVKNAGVKLLRLHQFTSGHVRLDDSDTVQDYSDHKERALMELLEDVNERTTVFARFTHDLKIISRVTEKLGLRYGEISGKRKDLGPNATYPENVDVLGVQIASGGLGIDLTRSSLAVYFSVDFSVINYLQSQARLCRPGQRRPVRYVHIVTEDTIDEMIYAALADRQDVIEAFLNDIRERQPVREEGRAVML